MKSITEERFDESSMDKPFAVGAVRGVWFGISLAIALVLLGAVLPLVWRWVFTERTVTQTVEATPKPQQPFQAATVYRNVPFIPLSYEAIRYGLNDPSAKKVIEREMLGRLYFEAESLKGGSRYIPILRDPSNVRSAVTFTNPQMKMIVVQLVTYDGSPGGYGLYPREEYEDDIRSLGK